MLYVKTGARYRVATAEEVADYATEALSKKMRLGGIGNKEYPVLDAKSAKQVMYTGLLKCDTNRENFIVAYLNTRHQVIDVRCAFTGTIDTCTVYIREILREALSLNAAALILAHNHPSGLPEPSVADIHLTEQIKSAASVMGIRLLDHIVIGESGSGLLSVSMAERGLL